jgi:hypothetical protein
VLKISDAVQSSLSRNGKMSSSCEVFVWLKEQTNVLLLGRSRDCQCSTLRWIRGPYTPCISTEISAHLLGRSMPLFASFLRIVDRSRTAATRVALTVAIPSPCTAHWHLLSRLLTVTYRGAGPSGDDYDILSVTGRNFCLRGCIACEACH